MACCGFWKNAKISLDHPLPQHKQQNANMIGMKSDTGTGAAATPKVEAFGQYLTFNAAMMVR